MAKYTVGLSAKEFRQLAKDIRKYRESLQDKCEELARRLAEEGVEIARMKISSFDAILTGELLASMNLEPGDVVSNGASYYIFTGCEWAKFVEFGTGIVGASSPHPDTSLVGWEYDTNEHGEAGWHYYKDGEWHWTKGMPSRPFMYETGQELRSRVAEIAQEVFADEI